MVYSDLVYYEYHKGRHRPGLHKNKKDGQMSSLHSSQKVSISTKVKIGRYKFQLDKIKMVDLRPVCTRMKKVDIGLNFTRIKKVDKGLICTKDHKSRHRSGLQ